MAVDIYILEARVQTLEYKMEELIRLCKELNSIATEIAIELQNHITQETN